MIYINSRKIYACYQKNTTNINDDGILEFWSANKSLYDMYVSIYGDYLPKEKYYHVILPFSKYEEFYTDHRMDMLDIFNQLPWDYVTERPYISTLQMCEILDLDEFLCMVLGLDDNLSKMVQVLPSRLRNVIYRTKWADMLDDPIRSDAVNWFDGDGSKLQFLAQACYYSEKDVLDITAI